MFLSVSWPTQIILKINGYSFEEGGREKKRAKSNPVPHSQMHRQRHIHQVHHHGHYPRHHGVMWHKSSKENRRSQGKESTAFNIPNDTGTASKIAIVISYG